MLAVYDGRLRIHGVWSLRGQTMNTRQLKNTHRQDGSASSDLSCLMHVHSYL